MPASKSKPLPPLLYLLLGAAWGVSAGGTLGVVYMIVSRPVALGVFMAGSGLGGLFVFPMLGALIGAPVGAFAGALYWYVVERPDERPPSRDTHPREF